MTTEVSQPVVASQPPVKIGKFQASFTIIEESWAVLKQDKEVMWFPVLSALVCLLILLLTWGIFIFLLMSGRLHLSEQGEPRQLGDFITYGMSLLYYIMTFFVVNFFEAGLFIIVQARFSGQDLNFKDGFNGAKKNIGKIFVWSLISATVGVILRAIADKSKLVGKIIVGLLGAAWNIMTFFSLPSLVIGNLSIKDSFKESATIIRKTWGETLIVNYGAGYLFSILIALLFVVSAEIILLFSNFYAFMIMGGLFVLSVVILSVIYNTLNSIFKLVLFNYARTGQIPRGFSSSIVKGAVK